MKNKQTVIEWFASELSGHLGPSHGPELLAIYNQALVKEKEQIIEANEDASTNEFGEFLTGEQYYNETYGK